MAVDDTRSGPRPAAVDAHQVEALDLEAEVGAHRRQQGDVAPALVAEVEVVADDHDLRAEALDQHLSHELLGRLLGPGLVEGQHDDVVDARGLQQLDLVLVAGELPRRRLRADDLGRVAVEGDDRRLQAPLGPGA